MNTVLVVNDSGFVRSMLRIAIERAGFRVVEAADGVEAMQIAESSTLRAVVSGWVLPRMDGGELVRRLRDHGMRTPVVIHAIDISADDQRDIASDEAAAVVVGPLDAPGVTAVLSDLLTGDLRQSA